MIKRKIWYLFLGTVILIFIADLVFLNWQAIKNKEIDSALESKKNKQLDFSQTTSALPMENQNCPNACLSQIYEATQSFKSSAPASQTAVSPTLLFKESIITLGSGSTQADDWEDIIGASAAIDSTKYGKLKSVSFEASVKIPNGNQGVFVRLFNVTDKHPVWFSEMYHEGGDAKLLISQPLTLNLGSKLYQVQMKTTLKYPANLNSAKIRITSE